MMPEEKEQLLQLFDDVKCWSQGAEARDDSGEPVSYSDKTAVAWDIVGGLCHLFGWRRACQLFEQLHRHMAGLSVMDAGRESDVAALSALLDFNDAADTTHERVMAMLREMPVWRGRPAAEGENAVSAR